MKSVGCFFALGLLGLTSCSRPQALFQRTPPMQYASPSVSAGRFIPPSRLVTSAKEGDMSANVPARIDNVTLPAGAQITAQLVQPVNSAYVQPGQIIPVRIINDVTVKKVKLIKGGAAGMATVLAVDRGKKNFVSIALTSVQAVDGQQIPVTSGQIRVDGRKGGTATGGWIGFGLFSAFGLLAVIGGAVSGGLLFIALGSLFGLIKKPAIPAEINVGTTLSGTTASEVDIDID